MVRKTEAKLLDIYSSVFSVLQQKAIVVAIAACKSTLLQTFATEKILFSEDWFQNSLHTYFETFFGKLLHCTQNS